MRKRTLVWRPAVCANCGESMLSSSSKKRFCSSKCANRSKRGLTKDTVKKYQKSLTVNCQLCGSSVKKIQSVKRKKAFCSREHFLEYLKVNSFSLNCLVCSKQFFTQPAQVKYRNRKTCSIECRGIYQQMLAEKRRLENPPTPAALARRLRYSKRMEDWRKAVFSRDDYTCQGCGLRGGYLEADHIKPFATHPDLRFELSNGRTLCRPCHQKTDTWGYRARRAKENSVAVIAD